MSVRFRIEGQSVVSDFCRWSSGGGSDRLWITCGQVVMVLSEEVDDLGSEDLDGMMRVE